MCCHRYSKRVFFFPHSTGSQFSRHTQVRLLMRAEETYVLSELFYITKLVWNAECRRNSLDIFPHLTPYVSPSLLQPHLASQLGEDNTASGAWPCQCQQRAMTIIKLPQYFRLLILPLLPPPNVRHNTFHFI